MAQGEAPSTEKMFEDLKKSKTSEAIREETRAAINEMRAQIKEFHNIGADDLHENAVKSFNLLTEKFVDAMEDNTITISELDDLKKTAGGKSDEKKIIEGGKVTESEDALNGKESTEGEKISNKSELLYTLDIDSLLKIFSDMKDGKVETPAGLRLSDIAPELRGQSEIILNFPGSFNWTDILLIPERVLRRKNIISSLLVSQINNPLTVNRLLYRSLNVMTPKDAYEKFIKVFFSESVSEKQREGLRSRIPPVISKQDTSGKLKNYLADNQEDFFKGMEEIDKVLTSEGSDALKNNETHWLLAKTTIESGNFGKTENLKYVISKYPRLAKLAIQKDPNNIMFLPTELRSDMVIIDTWIDALSEKDIKGGLNNIHLLVLDESYKLREVFEKIVAKFWNNEITPESIHELIKIQPKFEHIIRGRLEKTASTETNTTLKLLYSTTIDYQLSQAMVKNDEIKGENDEQQYYWDVKSIISKSIKVTSQPAQELAEANIDTLVDVFQSYEKNNIASKQEAISTLIDIFGPEDAKIFLKEFASTMIEKKEVEREAALEEDETSWAEVKDPDIKDLLSMNEKLQKITPDSEKIDSFIRNFVTEKHKPGITSLQEIHKELFYNIDNFDLSKDQKKSLKDAFEHSWDKMQYEFDKQNAEKIIDAIEKGESLEDIYNEDLVASIISGSVFPKNGEDNRHPDSADIPSDSTDSLSSIPEGVRKIDGGYVLETDSEPISITQADKRILEINPEAREDIIRTHAAFKKVGFENLWNNNKDDIFTSVGNVNGTSFSVDGNYINENELRVLFNSILISIGEEPIESITGSIDGFLTEMERRNNTNFSGTEAEVNFYGETSIEERFLNKYFPKGNMTFEYNAFEASIK